MLNKTKLFGFLIVSCLAFAGFVFVMPNTAAAATFTVDTTASGDDDNPGDGNCDNGSGGCTLQAGIQEANALAGDDTIEFNISGAGPHTITLTSDLPSIDEQLIIDGTTQTGASCGELVPGQVPESSNTPHNLLIEIDGNNNAMFYINSGPVEIRGLVLNNAAGQHIATYSDATIECNYIGTDVNGSTDQSGDVIGITGDSGDTVIENNLISGNDTGVNVANSTIEDNLIGTDETGTVALGNADGIITGGGELIFNNVIAGNNANGVEANSGDFDFLGNMVGLDLTGRPLGNGSYGILVSSGVNNYTIGSDDSDERNYISANDNSGLRIANESGQSCPSIYDSAIRNNSIGTNTDGEVEEGFGNNGSGIEINEIEGDSCEIITSVYQHIIGGESGQNIIAGNDNDGIRIFQSAFPDFETDVFSIAILANSIHSNGGLPINLATDEDNDGEADTDMDQNTQNDQDLTYPAESANNYINSPVINSANADDNKVTVNYDFSAPGVEENGDFLQEDDLIGFQLDFYINDGRNHLGSFIVNGPESGAEHVFTTELDVSEGTPVSATATVLWQVLEGDECDDGVRFGNGPPYAVGEVCG